MYFNVVTEGQTTISVNFAVYVIVILPADSRYKLQKYAVEVKEMDCF